jgi:hypothetical protein
VIEIHADRFSMDIARGSCRSGGGETPKNVIKNPIPLSISIMADLKKIYLN